MKKFASFDVDAQKGFTPICPQELPIKGGDEIVDELNRIGSIASARIGSKDAHPYNAVWTASEEQEMFQKLDYKNADMVWNRHCVVGTEGFELLDGLPKPEEYDFFVWKGQEKDLHPYGACYHDIEEKLETGVFDFLNSRKINTIVVGGLALDYCVKTTALQLASKGFKVYVYTPATRGISKETSEEAISLMKMKGIEIFNSFSELKTKLS